MPRGVAEDLAPALDAGRRGLESLARSQLDPPLCSHYFPPRGSSVRAVPRRNLWNPGVLTCDELFARAEFVVVAHQVLEQIDVVHRLNALYPDTFEMARTADDVVRIHKKGKIASLIGVEGGHSIGGSLGGSVGEMFDVVNMCMQRLRDDRQPRVDRRRRGKERRVDDEEIVDVVGAAERVEHRLRAIAAEDERAALMRRVARAVRVRDDQRKADAAEDPLGLGSSLGAIPSCRARAAPR